MKAFQIYNNNRARSVKPFNIFKEAESKCKSLCSKPTVAAAQGTSLGTRAYRDVLMFCLTAAPSPRCRNMQWMVAT